MSKKATFSLFKTEPEAAKQGIIKLGPWGGPGGADWEFNSSGDGAMIAILISHGSIVDSVVLAAADPKTGKLHSEANFGGSGGKREAVTISFPGEYLTSIKGTIAEFQGHTVIQSLTFKTNQKTQGPFGSTGGTPFEIPIEKGEIVGFFGRAGSFLDAIGSSTLWCTLIGFYGISVLVFVSTH